MSGDPAPATREVPSPAGSQGAAPVLGAHGVGKRYGERRALADVSVELRSGELLAVIGPNGAGKTTLLSILAGIQPPDEGTVSAPDGKIGWVPQQPALYSKLTVAENLRLFARLEGVDAPDAAVQRMLDQAALGDRAGDEVAELSGGNRQRVNIAIGLLAEPAVLLLDEPSAGLDPRQRERLWEFLGGLTERGTGVLYSTHNIQEAERYSDRVLVLDEGELLFAGSPRQLELEAGLEGMGFESAFVRFLHARGH